jgi:hypothetical protein
MTNIIVNVVVVEGFFPINITPIFQPWIVSPILNLNEQFLIMMKLPNYNGLIIIRPLIIKLIITGTLGTRNRTLKR